MNSAAFSQSDGPFQRLDRPEPIRRAARPSPTHPAPAHSAPNQTVPHHSMRPSVMPDGATDCAGERSAALEDSRASLRRDGVGEQRVLEDSVQEGRREDWLRLHSSELIDRLQSWSDVLDAREASLNAREATLEHRQRQVRTQRRESEDYFAEQQTRLERIRKQVKAHARRLAFDLP